MTGEIAAGRTGQIVVPELEEIRVRLREEEQAYNNLSAADEADIAHHERELARLRRNIGTYNTSHQDFEIQCQRELTDVAVRLLKEAGEIDERTTDECYKIFAGWSCGDEEEARGVFDWLVHARREAEAANPEILLATVNSNDEVVKLWSPSKPLIGLDVPLQNELPAIVIKGAVIEMDSDYDSGFRVLQDRKGLGYVPVTVDMLEAGIIISKDDERVTKLVGMEKVQEILDKPNLHSPEESLRRIKEILSARKALGLDLPGKELVPRLQFEFFRQQRVGQHVADIETLLGFVTEEESVQEPES